MLNKSFVGEAIDYLRKLQNTKSIYGEVLALHPKTLPWIVFLGSSIGNHKLFIKKNVFHMEPLVVLYQTNVFFRECLVFFCAKQLIS